MSGQSFVSRFVDANIDTARTISKEEYTVLAWRNGYHYEVMQYSQRLATSRARAGDFFAGELGLVSDYYGQGNRLLQQGKVVIAIEFYKRAFRHQAEAEMRLSEGYKAASPIDYEVLGAPSFAVASVPFFGKRSRERVRAVKFLNLAVSAYLMSGRIGVLGYALVNSKIAALTRGTDEVEAYRQALEEVARVRIDASSDRNTVVRIARHLRTSKEELYELCKSAR